MGSWNGTCMISNLPILSGEEVKLIFLHAPFGLKETNKASYCYPNGIFHPGAFPLDGYYDDYGGVEKITEDINFRLIDAYFKSKYKSIKVENKERKEFGVYDIMEGIERGNLKVLTEGDKERKKLAEGAIKAYSKSGFSSEEIKKEWEELANMDVSEQWRKSDMSFVMIRKDVWDGIIENFKTEFWKDDEDRKHPKDYYQTAQEWVEKRFKKYKESKDFFKEYNNPLSMAGYAGGNMMFMLGFYGAALNHCNDDDFNLFKKWFTEITIIESFLNATRKGWMFVSGSGSQSEEWEAYLLLNKIVDGVCHEQLKRWEEE